MRDNLKLQNFILYKLCWLSHQQQWVAIEWSRRWPGAEHHAVPGPSELYLNRCYKFQSLNEFTNGSKFDFLSTDFKIGGNRKDKLKH